MKVNISLSTPGRRIENTELKLHSFFHLGSNLEPLLYLDEKFGLRRAFSSFHLFFGVTPWCHEENH